MAPSKGSFQGLGLSPNILKGLAQMNYRLPTPVQRRSLPHSLSGVDTVVMARTGSGKTAAFLIPLLEKLKSHSRVVGCRAIVMSPSRELASQTLSFAKKMGRFTGIRFALIVGGDSMEKQFETLASNPDIIICTPGRLMHHLKEIKELSLKSVEMVIFDEADRLFEMGFAEQIHEIMRTIPEHRQNLLFSATMPPVLVQFARAGLMDPVLIRLDTDTKISESLSLAFFTVRNEDKPACLLFLLRQVIPSGNMTAIFAPTQHHVVFLQQLLAEAGISASVVYGSLDQQARQENLDCFRHGKTKLLLVTDVAARGIDIPLLNNVINYAFPFVPKLFVHRGGRAARQGRPGVAFSFVAPDELPYMIDLYKYLGKEPISPEDVNSSCSYDMSEITPANTHFGSFPQCVLDDEIEATRQIISRSRQSMLQQLENVARNAEKQYKRMRTDPDKRSIKASKQLNIGQVHPMLRKFDGGEAELEKKVYIDTMSSFRPKETILEVLGKGVKTGEDVMGAMRKKGRLSRLLNSAAAKTTTNQQMTTEKDSCDVEGGEGTKLNQADVGLAYIVNGVDNHCDVRKDGVMKDKYNEDEKDDESSSPHNPILGELALKSSSGQAKPRLSRAARKKLKKAEKEGEPVTVAPCVLSTCKGERKQKHREQQFGGGGKGMGAYADPEHFIGYGIDEATAMVNASLEPRTVEKVTITTSMPPKLFPFFVFNSINQFELVVGWVYAMLSL